MGKINCEWLNRNQCSVEHDGLVVPCCYIANWVYQVKYKQNKETGHDDDYRERVKKEEPVMRELLENESELSIVNNSLEDILSHEWYEKTLPESWEDETKTLRLCKEFCGNK